jgi:N-acetylglucosaminyldiphosphoundecaprenol N-acetyl-beta-D-mannosaminyltransferase
MEWLFRLLQEPKRLWRRYYQTNTAYALLLGQELRKRHFGR